MIDFEAGFGGGGQSNELPKFVPQTFFADSLRSFEGLSISADGLSREAKKFIKKLITKCERIQRAWIEEEISDFGEIYSVALFQLREFLNDMTERIANGELNQVSIVSEVKSILKNVLEYSKTGNKRS